MSKNIVYKTTLKSINKGFLSSVSGRESTSLLKKKFKDNGKSIFLINFNYKDKDEAFEKLKLDVDAIILNNINDVLRKIEKKSQVYLILNSPGGSVTAYADAATQILRLKKAGFVVTCFVDEVAASGGYMMASVCDFIVAQPFAFVGSIGVVAQMPIIEDLLTKHGVQFKVFTAGTNKRSVIPTKKPSEEEISHFNKKLEDIHKAFKSHVLTHRKKIKSDKLMDGDYYMAQDVLEDKFIDSIGDSRSAIIEAFRDGYELIKVTSESKKKSNSILSLFGVDSVIETICNKYIDKVFASSNPNELFK